jgi:hypothetical protein
MEGKKMKIITAVLVVLASSVVLTIPCDAQVRGERWEGSNPGNVRLWSGSVAAASAPVAGHVAEGGRQGVSQPRIASGTLAGAIVGGAVGLGVVAMTRGERADGDMFPWADLAAGAVLGSVPGMYLGARLSSGGEGNPLATGAAAVGGTALGIAAGVAVGGMLARGDTGKAPEILGIALGVAIPVGLTSFAEWWTAR